jgi:SPP1 gp7 family putative phage head morphogenesis protein
MNSREYWRQREEEALTKYKKSEAEYDKEIERIYKDMLDSCQKEIDAFYGKYADKEGISIAEAKKRVSKLDIEKYERKAARYVRDKDFSPKANEEMRLYNLTMKVNRLEMLKANIGVELIKGHDELDKFMGGILKGRTEEELKRQAGILGKTIRNNAQLAHAIPNASFHNATFSDRIWQYQDLMREDLSKILSSGLIAGKNPRAITKDLKKYWYGADPKTGGGAVYCMERLMRTELARVQTEAQKQSFEKNGFEEYMFIANSGCCKDCQALDGKPFKVSKMMPGENAAPLHPHCRCSVAAYEDSKEYEEWLSFLEKGGTTAQWEQLKELDTVPKLNAAKEKWLKDNNYDKYGDSLSDMEKGFWEAAAGGSMEVESAWLEAINNKIGSFLNKKGLAFLGKSGIMKSNKYGFNYIKGKHTREADLAATNPKYKTGREYQVNCQRCVSAYEARRRGYDVEAKPAILNGVDRMPYMFDKKEGWTSVYDGIKPINCASSRTAGVKTKVEQVMAGFGDGARAIVRVQWQQKYGGGGHVFIAEQVDGSTIFIDPQPNKTDVGYYFSMAKTKETYVLRIDDLEFTDNILKCCENKK